ncbi:MAG: hypothetical protein KC449_25075 [Anaerolineales bacterium]|nr:hypothetical protein [Anaerolineales bacterium]
MTEAKQESKYWGLYDRFGVTVGLIVDMAAIISFLLSIGVRSSNTDNGKMSDTALGIMALALIYSLGFINYQIYKRWGKVDKIEHEIMQRFVLALVTNFPFTTLYMHLVTNNRSETLSPFGGSVVLALLLQATVLPLVLLIGYGFELIGAREGSFR